MRWSREYKFERKNKTNRQKKALKWLQNKLSLMWLIHCLSSKAAVACSMGLFFLHGKSNIRHEASFLVTMTTKETKSEAAGEMVGCVNAAQSFTGKHTLFSFYKNHFIRTAASNLA